MLKFNVVRTKDGDIDYVETALTGCDLLGTPKLNKGCAFTREERSLFLLEGLLPYHTETLDDQVARMYAQFLEHTTNLAKNTYLNVLHDYNETLFYKLVSAHLEEMLPIIYTPIVGEAVANFSLQLRKTRGLYISFNERNHMKKIIENSLPDIDLLVVSDGEAVLGIGDQGIGGIKICNAKLMVYTLCAGINPHRVYPVQLDVGTNNPRLLNDPLYLGWRHERITGQDYDDFIDQFVTAVTQQYPDIYLHWEDFGRENARRILSRYRDKICTLNGDMQSTGTVALAGVLASCTASEIPLTDQRIIIFGAGTAGVGIAEQLVAAMQTRGLSADTARSHIWLIDKSGLLIEDSSTLLSFQKPFARTHEEITHWKINDKTFISLYEVISHVKPSILIGCSAKGGAFSEEDIRTMAANVDKPVIMPLSNPTTQSEAKPEDLLVWTQGRAIIATGSPFPEVNYHGHTIPIAQCNNALAFPGIGLGAIAAKAKRLSDTMLWVAAETLSQYSPIHQEKTAPVLPKISNIMAVSQKIALAVANQAREEGLTPLSEKIDLKEAIKQVSWKPKYYPYRKI